VIGGGDRHTTVDQARENGRELRLVGEMDCDVVKPGVTRLRRNGRDRVQDDKRLLCGAESNRRRALVAYLEPDGIAPEGQ
jgi:hypothetical protein